MPLGIAAGTAIAAGISAAGAGANAAMQTKLNKKNREWQEKMYQRQQDDNLRLNSPRAMMQRYQEAGLNPNLIYGQPNQIEVGKTGTPQQQAPQIDTSFASQGISNYTNLRANKAQTDLLQEQIKTQQIQQQALAIENAQKALDLNFGRQSFRGRLKKVGLDNKSTQVNTANTAINSTKTSIEAGTLAETSLQMAKAQIKNLSANTTSTTDANSRANQLQPQQLQKVIGDVLQQKLTRGLTEAQTEKTNVEIQRALQGLEVDKLEAKLAQDGVFKNDDLLYRILADVASEVQKEMAAGTKITANMLMPIILKVLSRKK